MPASTSAQPRASTCRQTQNPNALFLDGQQRLTSLTQVLKLTAPVTTQDEKKKEIRRYYYFDMEKAMAGPATLEDAIVAVGEDRVLRTNFGRNIVLDLSTPEKEYQAGARLKSDELGSPPV
jgi:hypothetical protein